MSKSSPSKTDDDQPKVLIPEATDVSAALAKAAEKVRPEDIVAAHEASQAAPSDPQDSRLDAIERRLSELERQILVIVQAHNMTSSRVHLIEDHFGGKIG